MPRFVSTGRVGVDFRRVHTANRSPFERRENCEGDAWWVQAGECKWHQPSCEGGWGIWPASFGAVASAGALEGWGSKTVARRTGK